ncbi:class I SAM-dependent methyltransferase [Ornithinimicrobium avium]|uniref:SAM-dependent methyltransferase n=1 Tax=Ornithinimicrobium avium TaxID=2283195 RepID=A0A345NPF5_9MICO|nr:class I SAM-dependent methyltransferase [Ornithinimicrobium avium]AXH96913.1 SAM-dependent methyltransferase [Ornithinimicrobium avium]
MTTRTEEQADDPARVAAGEVPAAVVPGLTAGAVPPAVRASAGWLALRREADEEARDHGAGGLLDRLVRHLHECGAAVVRVVDVGAGTGANRDYLGPRLPFAQEWVVVDHDAELLGHADHRDALRVEAGAGDLDEVLAGLPPGDGAPTVLTCAALLDVLDRPDVDRFAEAVDRSGAPALLSLSVTGSVEWSPEDPGDAGLRASFDAHQRRRGRPGPDAVRMLRDDLVGRGLRVHAAGTPWTLDARRPELLGRWLGERVEAAVEESPEQVSALRAWRARRLEQLAGGRLDVRVDHEDLLVLPR